MNKVPLSAFVITYNEEDRLAKCLESLYKWVDDVVVVDSGSTDNTVKIAEKYGARVFTHPFKGYGQQKRFAEDQCKHKWLFNLDADEFMSPALSQEIIALFTTGNIETYKSYHIKRQEILLEQEKPSRFAVTSTWLRLYHKDFARFQDCAAHDYVIVEHGKTGTLKNVFYHKSLRNWHHAIEKLNNYSDVLAQVAFAKGQKPSLAKFLLTPPLYLLKVYFLKRYFLQGLPGFFHSCSYVILRQMKYIKTLELFYKARRENQEK